MGFHFSFFTFRFLSPWMECMLELSGTISVHFSFAASSTKTFPVQDVESHRGAHA